MVAGLAIETKYPAATATGVILLYGYLSGRLALALAAAAASAAVFLGWETLMWARYGDSHFVIAYLALSGSWTYGGRIRQLAYGLVAITGTLGCGLIPMLALALWGRARAAPIAAIAVAAAVLAIAAGWNRWMAAVPTLLTLSGLLGLALIALFARALATVPRPQDGGVDARTFLLGWLAIELAAYWTMSPFPAARRVVGLLTVAVLLIGTMLAERRRAGAPSLRWLPAAAALSAAIGLAFWSVGLADATNGARLARALAQRGAEIAPGRPVWFFAGLAFEHHALAAGLSPVVIYRTVLRAGDLLAVTPPDFLSASPWDLSRLEPVAELRAGVNLGVRLTPDFFIGQVPLITEPDSRAGATIYRVTADTPLQGLPPARRP